MLLSFTLVSVFFYYYYEIVSGEELPVTGNDFRSSDLLF